MQYTSWNKVFQFVHDTNISRQSFGNAINVAFPCKVFIYRHLQIWYVSLFPKLSHLEWHLNLVSILLRVVLLSLSCNNVLERSHSCSEPADTPYSASSEFIYFSGHLDLTNFCFLIYSSTACINSYVSPDL